MNHFKPFTLIRLVCIALLWPLMMGMSNCNKEHYNNILPPVTHTGANTMGAYIGSTIWNPQHTGYDTGINCETDGSILYIRGEAPESAGQTDLSIQIYNYTGPGDYTLNNRPPANFAPLNGNAAYNQGSVIIGHQAYYSDSLHYCKVTITYVDSAKKIISGTFAFDAVNPAVPADVIHVTSGRFDVTSPINTVPSMSW